jgi:exopolyphosphatase/guanosine-5'-triphosphate,3'-diphosphate pyrophosphatase
VAVDVAVLELTEFDVKPHSLYPRPPRVRCACIDIGSNTTRVLVADRTDGGLAEVLQRRAFTRLGRGLDATLIALTAREVAAQAREARELGAASIRVVATAAVRRAANRAELCAAVQEASGLAVEILTGEEEARLAFAGATRTLEEPLEGEIGVVDVGGGSTELVVGTLAGGVSWCTSVAVGSGDLAETYLRSDPPAPEQLDAVRRRVAGALAGVPVPSPRIGLAVGGSATSLRRLVGDVLDPPALEGGLRVLAAHSVAEVARHWGLDPLRVRLLPAGILLLQAASGAFGCALRVARGGLREGVLLERSTTW